MATIRKKAERKATRKTSGPKRALSTLQNARFLVANLRPPRPLTRRTNRMALDHIEDAIERAPSVVPDYAHWPMAGLMWDVLTQWHNLVVYADEHGVDFWMPEPPVEPLAGPLESYAFKAPLRADHSTVRLAQARALQLVGELPRLAADKQRKARDDLKRVLPRKGQPGYRLEETRTDALDRLCLAHQNIAARGEQTGPGFWLSLLLVSTPGQHTPEQRAEAGRTTRQLWNGDSEPLVVAVLEALGIDNVRHWFSYRDKRAVPRE
jgi:hypothetical protein